MCAAVRQIAPPTTSPVGAHTSEAEIRRSPPHQIAAAYWPFQGSHLTGFGLGDEIGPILSGLNFSANMPSRASPHHIRPETSCPHLSGFGSLIGFNILNKLRDCKGASLSISSCSWVRSSGVRSSWSLASPQRMVLSKANVHGSIRTRNSPNWVELRLVQAPGLAVSEQIGRENPRPLRSTALTLAHLKKIRSAKGRG
jgi:hypothetical protein